MKNHEKNYGISLNSARNRFSLATIYRRVQILYQIPLYIPDYSHPRRRKVFYVELKSTRTRAPPGLDLRHPIVF